MFVSISVAKIDAMKDSFGVHFYVRNERADQNGKVPIFLRITVNGRRAELSVQRRVHPTHWHGGSGRVIGFEPQQQELNQFLEEIRAKVYKLQAKYVSKNKPYTAKTIRDRFLGKDQKHRSLLELYQEHNEEIKELVGREFSSGAYLRHLRTRKHLRNFINKKYQQEDAYLRDIDLRFITQFEHYLKVKKIGNQNTITKYIVNLKKIIRIAYANDWISKDPFFHWKAKWAPVEREALTERELQLLIDTELHPKRLEQVRDIFLFCCFTGLSYSDVKNLSDQHIVLGIDGKRWINTRRAKTDAKSIIPLLPTAENILSKYQGKQPNKAMGLLLPVISNQKLNTYLKEIAILCEITKKLTFHLSRHTFATTITLSNGVPIESVSRMLGHRSLKTTQIYAKVVDRKIMEDMEQLRVKYNDYLPNKMKKLS